MSKTYNDTDYTPLVLIDNGTDARDEREGIGAAGWFIFCAVVGAAMLIAALIAWGAK